LSSPHFLQRARQHHSRTFGRSPQQDVDRQADGSEGSNRALKVFARNLPRRDAEVGGGVSADVRGVAREPGTHLERKVEAQVDCNRVETGR
jgi:hypothetical protein